jgi:PTH2 family peptidyl-tRNA hydrolase
MEDHNSPEAVAKRSNQEDPIVMYLVVRESLGMSIGKACAQCAHASQMLLMLFREHLYNWKRDVSNENLLSLTNLFEEWLSTSFRKVVLRADDKEWVKVKASFVEGHTSIVVVDAGLTEIASGSETVIGLYPMRRSEAPKIIKKLQVLK